MNKEGFKEQIDLYRSITVETIKAATMKRGTIRFAIRQLTGIGNKNKCNICNYNEHDSCEECIHDYLEKRDLLPEKVLYDARYACITESFNNILNASRIDTLPSLLKKRADYLEKCLKIYKQEVKDE